MDSMVVPADVDLHLPSDAMFSIDHFVAALQKRRLLVDKEDDVERDAWRYTLVIDRVLLLRRLYSAPAFFSFFWPRSLAHTTTVQDAPTGPFTVELIEPHIVITHDMIDFDVSNLYVLAGYTQELGMRVDVNVPPYNITLEKLVENIQKKKFTAMRAVDQLMEERIFKMKKRGWEQVEPTILFVPPNPAQGASASLLVFRLIAPHSTLDGHCKY